jgi:hypothetical protein
VGYAYQRWHYGQILPRPYWIGDYILNDFWLFGLDTPPMGYEWVRLWAGCAADQYRQRRDRASRVRALLLRPTWASRAAAGGEARAQGPGTIFFWRALKPLNSGAIRVVALRDALAQPAGRAVADREG